MKSKIYIPLRIRSSWQRRKSQILTVPSSLQVANLWSVGLKLPVQKKKKTSYIWCIIIC